MSAEPNVKVGHPDHPDEKIRRAEIEKRLRAEERADWANLYHIYERCVEISEVVWSAKLQNAQDDQTALAEDRRDRESGGRFVGEVRLEGVAAEIPVPLFTPRDRQQFVKEVAATLLISADRRNLSVRFPKEESSATAQPEAGTDPGIEAASGADEGALDDEAGHLADAGPVESPHLG